jgi:hypothetical protein
MGSPINAVWLASVAVTLFGSSIAFAHTEIDPKYTIHDSTRPQPLVVDPGSTSSQAAPGPPPSDAIVLFDGKDLSMWRQEDGGAPRWKVGTDYFEVVPKTGDLYTRAEFGDCQLHVEFAEPSPPRGEDQDRGNSGVYLHGLYEVQVMDSYHNRTYPDGQAAAIYGQFPPLVNVSRPPGKWQSYDIIFHGPRFASNGKLMRPAHMTVLHNGVLVQDDAVLSGPTEHKRRPPYTPGPKKLPLSLQDHNSAVRYRNIWIRELEDH